MADENDDGPSVEDLIDPQDGTAGGGTATADATFGADEVDDQLGDDAPARPERGPGRDPLVPDSRAPGLSEDEVDDEDLDDQDLDNAEARARARRDAFVDQVLGTDRAVRFAYSGGPRIHPASSVRGLTVEGTVAFVRDDEGNAVCAVCGSELDEDEEGNVLVDEDDDEDRPEEL